jgi:hypothetical protein
MSVCGGALAHPAAIYMGTDSTINLDMMSSIKLMWKDHTYGGAGGKRIKDKDVRNCKIPVLENWDAGLAQSDWAKINKKFAIGTKFIPQDILLYEIGGKFIEHVDRRRPRKHYDHIGTLVVVAPTNTTVGGNLVVDGKVAIRGGSDTYRWAFVPLDSPHSVTEIQSKRTRDQARISLTFGVYEPSAATPAPPPPSRPRLNKSPGDTFVRIGGKAMLRKKDGSLKRQIRHD